VELSTRPENSIGSDEDWELATKALEDALKDNKISYEVNAGDELSTDQRLILN